MICKVKFEYLKYMINIKEIGSINIRKIYGYAFGTKPTI